MAAVVLDHGDGGIATITLNRPANLNALDTEVLSGLLNAVDAISQSSARVVVLSANGACRGGGIHRRAARAVVLTSNACSTRVNLGLSWTPP